MCFQDPPTVEGNQRLGGSNGFDGLVQEPEMTFVMTMDVEKVKNVRMEVDLTTIQT